VATGKWPPDWWAATCGFLDFDGWSQFAGGLIPLMDVRQFIYDFMRGVVDWLPHQPPEHSRAVYGAVAPAFYPGAKVMIPLGAVGYNALTSQVFIQTNKQSGQKDDRMEMDVQSVIPTIFQLLMMIPWDFMGAMEGTLHENQVLGSGLDKPPTAKDIVQWMYSQMREGLAMNGINLPALPGNYASNGQSFFSAVLQQGIPYIISNGARQYTFTLAHDMEIAPSDGASAAPQIVAATATTAGPDDTLTELPKEARLITPSESSFGFADIRCNIVSVTQGEPAIQEATFATIKLSIMCIGTSYVEIPASINLLFFSGSITYILEPIQDSIRLYPNDEWVGTMTANIAGQDPNFSSTFIPGTPALTAGMSFNPALFSLTWADGSVNGQDVFDGTPTTITAAITNNKGSAANLLPNLRTLALYNIPMINFCQMVYTNALELVNAIPRHPPAFSRDVTACGVRVAFFYRVKNNNPDLEEPEWSEPTTALPRASELDGKTLQVWARYDDDSLGEGLGGADGRDRLLLEHNFDTTSAIISFEAQSTGYDPYFSDEQGNRLPEVAVDDVATLEAEIRASESAVDAYTTGLATAENDLLAYLDNTSVDDQDTAEIARLEQAVTDQSMMLARAREDLLAQQRQLTTYGATLNLNMPRPSGIGLSCTVRLVGLTHGADAQGEIEARPTRFRLRVTSQSSPAFLVHRTIPSTYTNYKPAGAVLADELNGRIAAALQIGELTSDVVGATTTISAATASKYPWLGVEVRRVADRGRAPDTNSADPGASQGSTARLEVNILNTSDAAVVANGPDFFNDAAGNFVPMQFSVGGADYRINVSDLRDNPFFTIPAQATKSYNGTADVVDLADTPLSNVEVHFSAPLLDTYASRWKTINELTYVGAEANFGNPFNANPALAYWTRFVQCRLRYKRMDSLLSTGKLVESKNWIINYGRNAQNPQAPIGFCNNINIQYNAQTRFVTIVNSRNGQSIQIRTNACVWFMIQLFMMLPMEVI